MFEFLVSLVEISEFLPLFIMLIFTSLRYELIFLPLLDLLILKAAVVVLSNTIIFMYHEQAILICFIQNTYIILYFFMVSRLYKSILGKRFSNYFQIGNIIFLFAFILSSIWFDFRYDFFNYTISTVNVVFMVYGLLYFRSIRNNFVFGEFNNFFWLNIALLIYNVCMIPAMFFDRIIIGDSWGITQEILWSIVLFSSLLKNIFLCVFLYEARLMKEEQFDSL
jgi:hypothetical protein